MPQRAVDIGAEVVQIFSSNARTWRLKPYDPVEIAALRSGLDYHGLPLFFHAIYLINLASPDEELRRKSTSSLAHALFMGAVTGAAGVVTHVGSHRGEGFSSACPWVEQSVHEARKQAAERLEMIAAQLATAASEKLPALNPPADPQEVSLPELLLESSAGSAHSMGRDLAQLQTMVEILSPDCGLCLDTAHLFAAGRPIHTEEGLDELVAELASRSLLERVKLIHMNDCRTAFASGRDHHENIGRGQIGYDPLARWVRHPFWRELPFILEVPGEEDHGPDLVNVRRAKSMRRRFRPDCG